MMKTEIFEISPSSIDERLIVQAAAVIKDGGLVVFPTETVYGLGADATNSSAAEKIYKAKGRPSDNPLIIHVASPKDADAYAYTNDTYYKLATAFMPGPITVILKSKDSIPPATRGGLNTVAVRCPSNPIARCLIERSGVPIAAPSANISGSPSPTTAAHVIDDMAGRCDVIIDGGSCEFGLESTIVKVEDDGSLLLLRPGKITIEDILSTGITVRVAPAVVESLSDGERPLSPGMKYKHYAPRTPLVILDGGTSAIAAYLNEQFGSKYAIISYTEDIDDFASSVANAALYDFGARDDREAQAHRLFYILREADKQDFDAIYAPMPPKNGIGLALYNRMIRAAAYKIIRL